MLNLIRRIADDTPVIRIQIFLFRMFLVPRKVARLVRVIAGIVVPDSLLIGRSVRLCPEGTAIIVVILDTVDDLTVFVVRQLALGL